MRAIPLVDVYTHPIAQKYLKRSGIAHAIACAYHAYHMAVKAGVNPDLAAKAALLHDIGHYEWFTNGEWDYELYKRNDIHAIKGAERAHKLLIRLGEEPKAAKEIALAILLHTDSYLPEGDLEKNSLQQIVKMADEMDEEPGGKHHYRAIDPATALNRVKKLDQLIDQAGYPLKKLV